MHHTRLLVEARDARRSSRFGRRECTTILGTNGAVGPPTKRTIGRGTSACQCPCACIGCSVASFGGDPSASGSAAPTRKGPVSGPRVGVFVCNVSRGPIGCPGGVAAGSRPGPTKDGARPRSGSRPDTARVCKPRAAAGRRARTRPRNLRAFAHHVMAPCGRGTRRVGGLSRGSRAYHAVVRLVGRRWAGMPVISGCLTLHQRSAKGTRGS